MPSGQVEQKCEGIFRQAGPVHSLGGLVVFEVQENSGVTFRFYDCDHVDAKTDQPQLLQIEQAITSIDLTQGAMGLVLPSLEAVKPVFRERLFICEHFWVVANQRLLLV